MIKIKFLARPKITLADKLKEHQGVGPGFDAIRVYLSITIMALHSLTLAKGVTAQWCELKRRTPPKRSCDAQFASRSGFFRAQHWCFLQ